jgi:hypothetical protein
VKADDAHRGSYTGETEIPVDFIRAYRSMIFGIKVSLHNTRSLLGPGEACGQLRLLFGSGASSNPFMTADVPALGRRFGDAGDG